MSRFFIMVGSVFFALFYAAFSGFCAEAADTYVTAKLLARDTAVASGGDVVLAVDMVHEEGWHTYGAGSTTGVPTEIKVVDLPSGSEPEIFWPVATVYERDGISDRIYEGEILIPIKFAAPKNAHVGDTLHFEVDVSWIACKDMCVPGGAKLAIDLPVVAASVGDSHWTARIDEAMENAKTRAAKMSSVALNGRGMPFVLAVLFGIFGGLILNLMPCVFPVIGLKVFSLAKQAGQSRREAWIGALAFLAGVMATLWSLTAILVVAKDAGEAAGWGFQLQNPYVIYGGVLLFFILGLNLLGVFEIGMVAARAGAPLEGRKGAVGAFFVGVLAVIVATPCSAPLLGTAMSYALVGTALDAFVVFGAIGVGFSSPYLVFAAFPSLLRFLPKPGMWMVYLKKILSLFLFATAAYLIWILAAFSDSRLFNVRMIGALVLAAAATAVYGRMCLPYRKRRVRIVGALIAIKLLVVAVVVGWPDVSGDVKMIETDDVIAPAFTGDVTAPHYIAWKQGLPEKLAAEGHIVWVDFTARWCATCQVNKAVVFSSDEVRRYFREHEIYIVEADWTARNEAIANELAAHGRYAVPLNLVYAPGKETVELPTILTPGIVLEKLREAAK